MSYSSSSPAVMLRLFVLLCLLWVPAVWADSLQPFHWVYDVSYQLKKKTYVGTGYYQLELTDTEARFTTGLQSKNKILSSREWVVLRPHADYVAVPLYRRQRATWLGIPINKKVAMHPPAEGVYYDAMTVVLRILHDLRHEAATHWSFYLADDEKVRSFTLVGEETVDTPLGLIDCYLVQKDERRAHRHLRMWVAKQGHYIAAMEDKKSEDDVRRIVISNITIEG